MNISKAKFEQAMARERQQPYFEEFSTRYGGDELGQDQLAARLAALPAEFDVHDILPPLDPDLPDFPEWPKQALWVVKLAAQSAVDGFVPEERRIEGDYQPKREGRDYYALTTIAGNLTVTGNLVTAANLVVLGDVSVGGASVDDSFDYARTIIAGNFTVGKSLFTEGMLAVGGRMTAPFILLNFNQGYTTVLDGCTATFLMDTGHIGSQIIGESAVRFLHLNELQMHPEPTDSSEDFLPHLGELVQPAVAARFATLAAEYDDEQWEELMAVLDAGFRLEDPAVFRYAEAG